MHRSACDKMMFFKGKYLDAKDKLLIYDVRSRHVHGDCNHVFDEKNWKRIGIDSVKGSNVDLVIKDMTSWDEIDDGVADVVVCGQFFEGTKMFWEAIKEICRILKPGGYLCSVVSSFGPYGEKDYYRFSNAGLRVLAEIGRLDVVECITDNVGEWRDSILIAKKPDSVKRRKAKTDGKS